MIQNIVWLHQISRMRIKRISFSSKMILNEIFSFTADLEKMIRFTGGRRKLKLFSREIYFFYLFFIEIFSDDPRLWPGWLCVPEGAGAGHLLRPPADWEEEGRGPRQEQTQGALGTMGGGGGGRTSIAMK